MSKVGDCSQRQLKGFLCNSYYTHVLGRAVLLSFDYATLLLTCTLQCWVLRKEVSNTVFWVFGMTWPGIKPRSPRPLANTLPTRPIGPLGGARGVIVIVVRQWTRRHEFKSWTRLIAFHIALIPLGKVWIQLFSLQLWVNSRAD